MQAAIAMFFHCYEKIKSIWQHTTTQQGKLEVSLVNFTLSGICRLSRESSVILCRQRFLNINSTPSSHTGVREVQEVLIISSSFAENCRPSALAPVLGSEHTRMPRTDIFTLENSTQLLITNEGHTGISDSRSIKWEKETQTGQKEVLVDTLACN